MRIFTKVFIFIVSLALFSEVYAQDEHIDHDHSGHTYYKNEIGGALGVVFNLQEQHTASGFHIHYTRMFKGKLHNFGINPGVEFIVGNDVHYTLHFMLVYRPTHGWWLGAGPGITYFQHHEKFDFSGHIETGYEFDAGSIHFGPVIEYSWAEDDQHIMLGLHLGVLF